VELEQLLQSLREVSQMARQVGIFVYSEYASPHCRRVSTCTAVGHDRGRPPCELRSQPSRRAHLTPQKSKLWNRT
jgi:hypothetical protein